MDTTKQAQEGKSSVQRVKLQSVHRAILAAFDTRDIGADRQFWRHMAFSVAVSQRDPALFRECYLRSEVLKRFVGKGCVTTAGARATKAIAGLLADESHNRECVPRIVDICNRPQTPDWIRAAINRARVHIKDMLGPFSWEKLYLLADYSSGASTEHKRSDSHVQFKWESSTHITASALPHYLGWLAYIGEPRLNGTRKFNLVKGNVVFTVLKNFETDRVIAKEPPLNMFLQKGYGSIIRRAVNREGLLHPDAQEYHARLAMRGSIDGSLATADMKSASNSNILALVEELLPIDHLEPILALRSPQGILPDGSTVTWEMVSSMGNGFTFELETLVFYALARAVCGKEAVVSVYGDDIVVPSRHCDKVLELMEYVGYRTNRDKTFSEGPFRESCGGHYFDGQDVTPFYIEDLPNSEAECVDLHNRMLEWGSRGGDMSPFWAIINAIRAVIPKDFRGPFGESGVLWSNWDQAAPRFHISRNEKHPSYNCWVVKSFYRKIPKQDHDYLEGCLLSGLWSGASRTERLQVMRSTRRDPLRGVSPKVHALMFKARCDRDASRAEITFAKYGRWAITKRLLRVSRQWTDVPVMGWREHSVR